ncbi:MAG: rhamnulose-1-phosphate aldolase [Bacteroidota bacterium]
MIGNIDNLLNFTNDIFQKKELRPVMNEIAGIAQHLWNKGWAERNAGNFSINVTGVFSERELDNLSSYPFFPLPREYPDLARTLFLVSGTGTRMRDVAINPSGSVCFVYVGATGSAFHIIRGGNAENALMPTSELSTHLAIQQLLIQRKLIEKVVLHAHVTELIALTQLSAFKTEDTINSLLWGMHPETILFVPGGVGFIPYTLPGTENIATATLAELGRHKAILWEKHGCISIGDTLPDAFDILDILAKSAKIYFLCKAAGFDPEGLTQDQIQEIREYHS